MTGRPRRFLVVVASRHGATREIAQAIAERITESPAGLTAVVLPVEQRPDPRAFTAVVLGSAVYLGHWLEEARTYAAENAEALRERPVWLFSSGPIGEPPFPPDEPYDAAPLQTLTGARAHRVFPGRLDRASLGFRERAMVTALRAPVGDFRDWAAVREFADEIARALVTRPEPVTDMG